MSEGEIKESGTHKELVKKPNSLYKRLFNRQMIGAEGISKD